MGKETTPIEKSAYEYPQLNERKLALEEQAAAAIWLQAFGIIAEAVIITKLLPLEYSEEENQIVIGVWIQAIGQLLEAIGVTREITSTDAGQIFKAQRTAVDGDWLQAIGATLEAAGGERAIARSLRENRLPFIP
ncbi:hypothetical protein [Bacillus sp. FJAT-27251]|uniref:DUF6944 family repetitive protein n=1 Tax=Bacillus sp. FJAT-27251 TaxID=1684142 RepID=UPI0006A7B78D|nr:hypothetical protein [Bacillus sp. FJAT-27251]